MISPSLLNCAKNELESMIKEVQKYEIDELHIDIMDGIFVPNTAFSDDYLDIVKLHGKIPLDFHLMVQNPEERIEKWLSYKPKRMAIPFEIGKKRDCVVEKIKKHGVKVGMSVNPETSLDKIKEEIDMYDYILVMSVNPGFGGQNFIPETIERIKEIRKYNKFIPIQVDGGIELDTGRKCIETGATMLVSGSSFLKAKNKEAWIKEIKG